MTLDIFFIGAGIALVLWGAVALYRPDLNWAFVRKARLWPDATQGDQPAPDWPRKNRNMALFLIVAGVLNAALSVLSLARG